MGAAPPPPGGPYEEPRVPWTAPPLGTAGPPLAGRWRRLFAGIVDAIIVGLISSPFAWSGWMVLGSRAGATGGVDVSQAFLAGVIGFLYYWLLQSFWNGWTVGKRLFGMRVVRDDGSPAGPGTIAVRQLVEVLLGWLCILGLVDLAWILFDRRKQALHDKAAGTLVVDS
ncbi:RDD family protein [Microbispora sp. RL4-1S]|uniref:RDD family protein n=1 Tax=Microbispora oryzae TaxID=2806554 RepID=A0A940WKG2_9ACTN|nr:RDD family protein [Microbispora oryzae]MBP2707161.1 RDD family protein [Microbispora oryzae]